MEKRFPSEFTYQIFSLIIAIILVHSIYVTLIRPAAAEALEIQAARLVDDPSYVPQRSWYVVIRDFEQEVCFVLMFWGVAILGYKSRAVQREQRLFTRDLLALNEGTRILQGDARKFARHIQALPPNDRGALLPRCLLAGLDRFAATGNIRDVSATSQAVCQSEAERQESELSMIRYIVWAIPSIGFIGTVRGIGDALGLAYKAVEGDITGVTQSLGVAFNSTFVALLLSLVLMFLVHQFQLIQERVVLDTQAYCERHLVGRLAVDPGS
jgi:biopolymer transport protein ExbB/TolQ